MDLGNILYKAL